MLGAIIGDIFENFFVSDNSIMTVAVCDGILSGRENSSDDTIQKNIIKSIKKWKRKYPIEKERDFMCVSSVGWLFNSLERTLEVAEIVTKIVNNDLCAIKNARTIAGAIFLARIGANKKEVVDYIADNMEDVFTAIIDAESFDQVMRNAISIKSNMENFFAVCGSIAEPLLGIPDKIIKDAETKIKQDVKTMLCNFFIERYGDFSDIHREILDDLLILGIDSGEVWGCSIGYGDTINMIYTDRNNKIHYFSASGLNGDFNISLLEEHFRPLSVFNKTGETSKGWSLYYLGCGYSLLIEDSLYEKIEPYIREIPEYEMYNKWIILSVKILMCMGYFL